MRGRLAGKRGVKKAGRIVPLGPEQQTSSEGRVTAVRRYQPVTLTHALAFYPTVLRYHGVPRPCSIVLCYSQYQKHHPLYWMAGCSQTVGAYREEHVCLINKKIIHFDTLLFIVIVIVNFTFIGIVNFQSNLF